MLPAVVLTYGFGGLLLSVPGAVDWRQGWIWTKLALVLLLTVFHVKLARWRRRLRRRKVHEDVTILPYGQRDPDRHHDRDRAARRSEAVLILAPGVNPAPCNLCLTCISWSSKGPTPQTGLFTLPKDPKFTCSRRVPAGGAALTTRVSSLSLLPLATRYTMNLQELKRKSPAELLAFAEELQIENASSLRKQDMMFAILKQLAENDVPITGDGVLEVLSDGFGFLRSPEANYLPGPDDIYVSPNQVRRFGLRTGDTVEGQIRSAARRRTLFRAAQGQQHQFRGARPAPPPDQFRQSDAALSRGEDPARAGRSEPADLTTRVLDLITPLGKGQRALDRLAAAHRQDRDAAEHRARAGAQPSRSLSDRAA